MQSYTYAIIGASAAGISALNTLWQVDPTASVACISDQENHPYNTCFLIDYAAGIKSIEQIALRIAHQKVHCLWGKKVIAIDREKKSIALSDNSEVLFQKLLIATGSQAVVPSITGIDTQGVFSFHTLVDAQKILRWIQLKKVKNAVIIGGGLTGLECADMLYQHGIAITIIEKNAYTLSAHLPANGAAIIGNKLAQKGVHVIVHQQVVAIERSAEGITALRLDNGTIIATDLVIYTVGIKPNSELAFNAGLTMQAKHIAIDAHMQTSDPSIFAAGDVAALKNQKVQWSIWAQAVAQGIHAACAMTGNIRQYKPEIALINSHFFDLTFAQGTSYAYHTDQQYMQHKEEYCCITSNNGTVTGFQFIGTNNDMLIKVRRAMFAKQSI